METTNEYKSFEKLCKEMGYKFNADVFQKEHLDSGNLFAFYSKGYLQAKEEVEKIIDEYRKRKYYEHNVDECGCCERQLKNIIKIKSQLKKLEEKEWKKI